MVGVDCPVLCFQNMAEVADRLEYGQELPVECGPFSLSWRQLLGKESQRLPLSVYFLL